MNYKGWLVILANDYTILWPGGDDYLPPSKEFLTRGDVVACIPLNIDYQPGEGVPGSEGKLK